MATKKYKIGNPRNVSEGTHVIAYEDQKWFEGDDFVAPKGFLAKAVQDLIDQGLILEVEA